MRVISNSSTRASAPSLSLSRHFQKSKIAKELATLKKTWQPCHSKFRLPDFWQPEKKIWQSDSPPYQLSNLRFQILSLGSPAFIWAYLGSSVASAFASKDAKLTNLASSRFQFNNADRPAISGQKPKDAKTLASLEKALTSLPWHRCVIDVPSPFRTIDL